MAFLSSTVSIGESTKKSHFDQLLDNTIYNAAEIKKHRNSKSVSANHVILDNDGYALFYVSISSTISLPTAADNEDRQITIMHAGASGTVTIEGENAETIDGFSNVQLMQRHDFVKIISNGLNWLKLNSVSWHKIANPSTGYMAEKTTWASADSFSAGLEVTFTGIPTGTKAVRVMFTQMTHDGGVYYRKSGDTNISNTPSADTERSHELSYNTFEIMQCVIWLSSDYKAQFTVAHTDIDIYISHPIEYLI